ncbi:MAG: orotidine-5'-phosphate decarboxylase [Spirochaetia bacterium]
MPQRTRFIKKITKRWEDKHTLLCVGLDPRLGELEDKDVFKTILSWSKEIIEETKEYTACYKPNIAFYEQYGPDGLAALEETLKRIPDEIAVLIDAKRSDIGATAQAYAEAIFGRLDADAVTLSPYMGRDAVDPFLCYEDRFIFMLARTSNPTATQVQLQKMEDGTPLYLKMSEIASSWDSRIGLVVAANLPDVLRELRAKFPKVWFLAPGIGAQGGGMEEAVAAGCSLEGLGILPVVARGITAAKNPVQAASEYVHSLQRGVSVGKDRVPMFRSLKERVLLGLVETECFKIGEFTLKSGKKSPFYVDLRRVQSSPELLKLTAKAYATLMEGKKYDRIAGIPAAALPLATAVSLETGIPLIYPRIPVKPHGTGNRVEGAYNKGETVLLLDDLITTGKSKVEAIEVLKEEGLVVEDLAVLIERGKQGREDMEEAGINLYTYIQIEDLLDLCRDEEFITAQMYQNMKDFLKES